MTLERGTKGQPMLLLAFFLCSGFGLAHIVNVHPIGDGIWFWYAHLWRHGVRLYADTHLSLQPFFIQLTALFQCIFGESWIAMKVLPVLQLVTYTSLVAYLCSMLAVRDWIRALLLSGIFFLTITSPFYRFDDYHVTSDIFQLIVFILLIKLYRGVRKPTELALITGICCGLCAANRLNDGATLFIGCLLATAFLVKRNPISCIAWEIAGTVLSFAASILATLDSPKTWWTESVVRAAAIKGGTGSVLLYPLTAPFRMLTALNAWRFPFFVAYFFAAGLLVAFGVPAYRRGGARRAAVVILSVVVAVGTYFILKQSLSGRPVNLFTSVIGAMLFPLALWIGWRALRHLLRPEIKWNPLEILLLIPLGQLIAGAMTSATSIPDLYPPVAGALILAPFAIPPGRLDQFARFLAGVALVITVSTGIAKAYHPYFWHLYNSHTMFEGRTWYHHPLYGWMYIEREQLEVATNLCEDVDHRGGERTMLTMPYPYFNWFCGIPPWHDYVQTWYDTSGAETIDKLRSELAAHPPHWIVYQHDPSVIRVHEAVFRHGQPLPHRYLDQDVMKMLLGGVWSVASFQCYNGSDWILIETVPSRVTSAYRDKLRTREETYCSTLYRRQHVAP